MLRPEPPYDIEGWFLKNECFEGSAEAKSAPDFLE
jgi:hypothetical protein